MDSEKTISGLYDFLKQSDVLDKGPIAMANAKREYRTLYNRLAQKQHRAHTKQYTVSLSKSENRLLAKAAKNHSVSISVYLRKSSLAYTQDTFLVPHPKVIAGIRQSLSQVASDIRYLISSAHPQAFELEILRQRVFALEDRLTDILTHPEKDNHVS